MSLGKQLVDIISKNNNNNIHKYINVKFQEGNNYDNKKIYSSVLVIIHFYKKKPYVLLTKRSSLLKNHAGEISFPGGKFDINNDASILDTALRETREEINIIVDKSKVVGCLNPINTYTTKILIFPFVTVCEKLPNSIKPNIEVEQILNVSIHKLKESLEIDKKYSTNDFTMFHFNMDGMYIWGATARILKELLDII